jgi:hypothetical protein
MDEHGFTLCGPSCDAVERCFAENPRFTYYVDIFFTVVARFNWKNYYAFKTESLDRFGSKGLLHLSGVDAFLVKN